MIRHILAGHDGSDAATRAMEWVAELAEQTGARVTAVHAFEPLTYLGIVPPPIDFAQLAAETRETMATQWCEPLIRRNIEHESMLVEDRPVSALVDTARERGADMIVVAAKGTSQLRDIVVGSVAMALPHHSRVPVTIVPSH